MRGKGLVLTVVVFACLAALWPAPASAQHRRHYGGSRVVVYSGWGYGYPFYTPYWGLYDWWYPSPYFYPRPYWSQTGRLGSVRLQVTPRETEVYVDGYQAGTVDDFDGTFQRLRLPAGRVEITLYLEGYKTVRQSLDVRPGGDYRVRHSMVPLVAGESPEPRPVPSEPPPATAERPEPPRGPYVQPRARGARTSNFGAISVRVQPPDARVLIDGEEWTGPEDGGRLVVQMAEGPHRLEVLKKGYIAFSTEVEVRRGETTTLNVSLPEMR